MLTYSPFRPRGICREKDADVIAGDAFDAERLGQAATERVKSAERLRDAIVKALSKIHALLTPVQRGKLAYLIRTGALLI